MATQNEQQQSWLGKVQDFFNKTNNVTVPVTPYTQAAINGTAENPVSNIIDSTVAKPFLDIKNDYNKAGGGGVGVGSAIRGGLDRYTDYVSRNVIEPFLTSANNVANYSGEAVSGFSSGLAKGPEQAARDFQAQQAANHSDAAVGDPGSPKAPLPAAETNGALSYLGDPALPSKAPGQSAAETNGALSYLGNKSVEAGLANRTKGADLVANQGFTQVDNLQAAPGNYKGNPFFRKTTDLGNGMEEYKVEIPGKGWMTGVRKSDPNRQQGTFSVTPGLSDAERQQVAQIDANQARQAAYGVSRKTGELYDAAQQHQQQQAVLAALKQMQMQQEQNYRNQQLSLEQRKAAAAEANNAGKLMVDQGNMLTQGRRAEQQSAHDRASRQDNFMKDHFRKWATESPAGIQSKNQWDDFATSNLGVLSAGARTNEPPKFATPYASKTAGMIDMVYPDGKVRTVPYIDYVDALSQ